MTTPITVLHVDDDEMIRDLVKAALEFNGAFQVWSCDSGAEALKIAPAIAPDLILLDMNMPGMTGLQTLKNLRSVKCFADTPVIFITSNLKRHEIQSYYDYSAIGFIPKPFDTNMLSQDIFSLWNANKLVNYTN